MMLVRKALITALALAVSAEALPADTCANQSNCMDITVTKVTGTKICSGTSLCEYKVCVKLNGSKNGCVKGTQDAWSHTCEKSSNDNECEVATGFKNAMAAEKTNIPNGWEECQIVKAGENAEFLFKDGSGCDAEGAGQLTLPSGAKCAPTTADKQACTGNKKGFECIWTIPTPKDCTGGGGGGGDPHFRTYDGTLYSYHGECDLIMAQSSSFDNGLGLDVHSRTKMVSGVWSLISNTAIRIGSDILEVNNRGIAFVNHNEISTFPMEMANKFTVTKEIQVVEQATNEWNETFSDASEKEELVQYTIDLNKRSDSFPFNSELQNQIIISIYRTMISVKVDAHLQDAEGMLGNHITYGLVGRDRSTVYTNPTDMGAAWQVTDADPLLFNDAGSVVYPERCIVPTESVESQSRRLRSVTSQEDLKRAQNACAKLSSDLYPFCVEDILRTGDFQIANGYAF